MLVATRTDAPVYHWPLATVSLIVTIALLHVAGISDPQVWVLRLGHGIHPSQWLSRTFVHFGLTHLIGST